MRKILLVWFSLLKIWKEFYEGKLGFEFYGAWRSFLTYSHHTAKASRVVSLRIFFSCLKIINSGLVYSLFPADSRSPSWTVHFLTRIFQRTLIKWEGRNFYSAPGFGYQLVNSRTGRKICCAHLFGWEVSQSLGNLSHPRRSLTETKKDASKTTSFTVPR